MPKRPSPAPARAPAGRRARRRPVAGIVLKWLFVAAIWLALVGGGGLAYFALDLPSIDSLEGPALSPAVRVLAADGTPLAIYGDQTGDFVAYDALPQALIEAVLAIEDRRFFDHAGIDLLGVLRAAFRNLEAGEIVEGGSTITQQLAKITFLSSERTFKRKIQESMIAVLLERRFTKEEILTIYLNRVYLGAGTYGVDAAARRYFDKPVGDIGLGEAALLAGLLKAPSRYAPTRNAALARERAQAVLASMVAAGFIGEAEAAAAFSDTPASASAPAAGIGGRYFTDWVLDNVAGYIGPQHGALTVATTLDPRLQALAEETLRQGLAEGSAARVSQGALVVMAPDGRILAMVGGRDYGESQFNRATQALRQPGSAFKPVVYLAALEEGLAIDDRVLDAPVTIGDWSPENYDGRYAGQVTVREAFARSLNTAAVRIAHEVGVEAIQKMARRLGIGAALPDDLTLSLGAGGVSLIDLTQAYATIAAGGLRVLAHGIARIDDKAGATIYEREGSGAGRAFSAATGRAIEALMAAVIGEGTGRAAQLPEGLGPVYGKTGTSQDFRDAWFVGFGSGLVVGVWLGNDDAAAMAGVTGGGLPAVIWHRFMIAALRCEGERFAAGCPWLDWRNPLGETSASPPRIEPGKTRGSDLAPARSRAESAAGAGPARDPAAAGKTRH